MRQQLCGEDTVTNHTLLVIDVVDEHVDRAQSLRQALLDEPPLLGGDDSRHYVERPRAIDATTVGVDGERDTHADNVQFSKVLALLQLCQPKPLELLHQLAGCGAGAAITFEEFVP